MNNPQDSAVPRPAFIYRIDTLARIYMDGCPGSFSRARWTVVHDRPPPRQLALFWLGLLLNFAIFNSNSTRRIYPARYYCNEVVTQLPAHYRASSRHVTTPNGRRKSPYLSCNIHFKSQPMNFDTYECNEQQSSYFRVRTPRDSLRRRGPFRCRSVS